MTPYPLFEVVQIPIEKIYRVQSSIIHQQMNEPENLALVDSIIQHGIIRPLVVSRKGIDRYTILVGQHRGVALEDPRVYARLAGVCPCVIVNANPYCHRSQQILEVSNEGFHPLRTDVDVSFFKGSPVHHVRPHAGTGLGRAKYKSNNIEHVPHRFHKSYIDGFETRIQIGNRWQPISVRIDKTFNHAVFFGHNFKVKMKKEEGVWSDLVGKRSNELDKIGAAIDAVRY